MSKANGQLPGVRKQTSFVFFGTDEFSVIVLEELKKAGFIPTLIVTAPDRPKGRGMKLTPPPVKLWAEKNQIEFLQPEKLDNTINSKLKAKSSDIFIVASYGKIIPWELLYLPRHDILNVHPSLLPLYRGPSPIQYQILDGVQETGVTIIRIDEEVDHGPIVGIRNYESGIKNLNSTELGKKLAHMGGKLLVETIPKWVRGEITPREQDHNKATYTKMIKKEDGLIDLSDAPELNYRKFLAYTPWLGIYFFKNNMRIKITDAELQYPHESALNLRTSAHEPKFMIKKVIPEGKKETDYGEFLKNNQL